MRVICAWCGAEKSKNNFPGSEKKVSHGICEPCKEKILTDANIKKEEA